MCEGASTNIGGGGEKTMMNRLVDGEREVVLAYGYTSISSSCCQSGRSAATDRSDTADSRRGGVPRGRSRIFPTRPWEAQEDATKAAGAWSSAL